MPNDPKDLFAYKINYDVVEPSPGYSGRQLYNGGISEVFWRTILLYLLFNKNYFIILNRYVVFCFFFSVFLLVEYQIKKLLDKY